MKEVVRKQALFCRSWAGQLVGSCTALGGLESCRGIGDPWGFPLSVTEAEHWGNFTGKPSLDLRGCRARWRGMCVWGEEGNIWLHLPWARLCGLLNSGPYFLAKGTYFSPFYRWRLSWSLCPSRLLCPPRPLLGLCLNQFHPALPSSGW